MGGGGWVIDSDYRRKLGTLVLEHADTVVWLDLPLRVCLRRLWGRTLCRGSARGEELWNGNRESWRAAFWGWDSLFVYAVRKHVAQRRALPELLARPELAHLEVVRLRYAGGGRGLAGNHPGRRDRRRLNHRGLRASIPLPGRRPAPIPHRACRVDAPDALRASLDGAAHDGASAADVDAAVERLEVGERLVGVALGLRRASRTAPERATRASVGRTSAERAPGAITPATAGSRRARQESAAA